MYIYIYFKYITLIFKINTDIIGWNHIKSLHQIFAYKTSLSYKYLLDDELFDAAPRFLEKDPFLCYENWKEYKGATLKNL